MNIFNHKIIAAVVVRLWLYALFHVDIIHQIDQNKCCDDAVTSAEGYTCSLKIVWLLGSCGLISVVQLQVWAYCAVQLSGELSRPFWALVYMSAFLQVSIYKQ